MKTKQQIKQEKSLQAAKQQLKHQIFESYCDFLNYFDASIRFQLSFLNQRADLEEFKQSIDIPNQADDFNPIRREYTGMLMADRKKLKNPKGLYHKGTGIPRQTQAVAPFAAQMDGRGKGRTEEPLRAVYHQQPNMERGLILW